MKQPEAVIIFSNTYFDYRILTCLPLAIGSVRKYEKKVNSALRLKMSHQIIEAGVICEKERINFPFYRTDCPEEIR
ncbi:MAG: hypothetical protein IPN20_23550 [Haliscomenobacter sp.]|nr:hypothetical protein [Haliscomenobacter sp.]